MFAQQAATGTGCVFGPAAQPAAGGLFGAAPQQPAAGGLFGSPQQQQQPQQGGMFSAQPQQPQQAMFAPQPQAQQQGVFGAPQQPTGGLFGAQPQQQQQVQHAGGLFGAPQQQPAAGGLFGVPQQQQQPAAGGMFGVPAQQQQQPAAGSLFGAAAQPQQQAAGGLFGVPQAQPQAGLFGAQPQAQQPAAGGVFGAPAQQQQQPAGGVLFGAQANAAPAAGCLFGAQQQQQPAAGGMFGAPAQPPAAGGLFGAQPQQQLQQAGGLFGAPQQQLAAGGMFGATPAQPAAGGLFGAQAVGAPVAVSQIPNPNQSVAVPVQCDSISSMSWSGSQALAVGSWDRKVRVFTVAQRNAQIHVQQSAEMPLEAPVSKVRFSSSGSVLVAGDVNGGVYMSRQASPGGMMSMEKIGAHAQGSHVVGVGFVAAINVIVSVAAARTPGGQHVINFWSPRANGPADISASMPLPGKPFAADANDQGIAVGLRPPNAQNPGEGAHAFAVMFYRAEQLAAGNSNAEMIPVQFSYPIVDLSLSPDDVVAIVGSCDGRASVVSSTTARMGPKSATDKGTFRFKVRDPQERVLSQCNGVYGGPNGTVVTANGHGYVTFWNRLTKSKGIVMKPIGCPVTAVSMAADGTVLAIAGGYDWHAGASGSQSVPTRLFLHPVQAAFFEARKKK